MPPVPEPVELLVPADVETMQILDALARRFEVRRASEAPFDREYLDTFDGRLRRAGLWVSRERCRGRTADEGVVLTLTGRGVPGTEASLPTLAPPPRRGQPDRVLVNDLPDGPLRDVVSGVVDVRALLPTARVRGRATAFTLRNGEGKTLGHVAIEDPLVVERGKQARPLARRVRLSALLGYSKELRGAAALLQTDLGLEPATASLAADAADAAAALGLDGHGAALTIEVGLEPGMRADEALILVSRRLAEIVEANLPGTVADLDAEFLHDLRVAVRRSRSVLKELKGVLPAAESQQARDDLRWVQEITGPTRDLDVQLQEWPETVAAVPASMAPDLEPLHDLLLRHRAAAFATMRRRLNGRQFAGVWERWRTLVDEPGRWSEGAGPSASTPVGELAGSRIVSLYKAMMRMGARIDDSSPAEALHDLRKRGKELRYLMELFGGLWPARTVKPLVGTLKDLQDVLGRFQDDEIHVTFLRGRGPELAAAPGGPDALIALGAVIENLTDDQHRARAEFAARFAAFSRRDNKKLVEHTFGTGGSRGRRGT